MFKPTKNVKVIELVKSCKDRSYNLATLKPIKSEELNDKGNPRRFCAWCTEVELFHGNQKYCSNDCSTSAMAVFYPQKEDSLRFLLIKQEWKCADCQFDYRPIMQAIIDKERARRPYAVEEELPLETLECFYFNRLKNNVPFDKRPEVDHILAICRGGNSLGLDNHQVLCYTCHKSKTKIDLSGKRIKNNI